MKINVYGTLLALTLGALLSACSTQTMYSSAQAWQRNECQRMNDKAERDRCLAANNESYDNYRKQSEGDRKQP